MMTRSGISGLALTLGALLWLVSATAVPLRVNYPQAQRAIDRGYFVKLLEMTMEKSGVDHVLHSWDMTLLKGRALSELEHGQHLDVVWAGTNHEREQLLLPVRIPLERGLSGWRVALIRKEDAEKFKAIQTLADLRRYTAGQGFDWADAPVLRASGLPLVTGVNVAGLSLMLAAHRFDYFPRSVREIWDEAEQQRSKGLEVETSFALHYPAAVYFFVRKDNLALAQALETGLRRAMADGSFERLFREFNGDALQRANFNKRRIFELENPGLPASVPLQQKEFWYEPERCPATMPTPRR